MKVCATYRLQLNRGFAFADAEAIVPYLDALGISHVYASPVTAAQPGSSHGYDVIDPTRVNPELGGEAGLRRLVAALRARGMGLVIDIVPNHMSVTGGANAWWNDVLAKGRESPYARFFDIDWGEKILLPFLGDPPGEALAKGALALERDREGRLWIVAYGHDRYPVCEEDQSGGDLAELLERQHYRLAWWREADTKLNWRRFFTISGLAGVRVEDEAVFEATHAFYFRLWDEGLIDGVRVDHVDGLADPGAYCRKLRARMPEAWIVVEKILGGGEDLPEDWGVDGTSGYDFMEEAGRLLHDPAGAAPLSEYWTKLSGRPSDFAEEEHAARRELLAGELSGQFEACAGAFGREGLERVLCAFPVYRTYGGAGDEAVLEEVRRRVGGSAEAEAVLARLGEEGDAVRRFRQLSAPLSAKAVEDTAFYRFGRLLSRNEVGADPACFAMSPADFHAAMAKRAERWPGAMLATATHDHKRGEDVRARLGLLSELPDEWIAAAERWRALNRDAAEGVDPADEYLLYQTLFGAWPADLSREDSDGCAAYRDRLWGWLEKALREAKLRSSWTEPNAGYEGRCRGFVERIMDPARSARFLADAHAFVRRLAPAGEANALVQAFLRCLAPGVPDCYQGCEFADLSLVDPDNRRPVDYAARAAALGGDPQGFDATKQHLIARLLRLRPDDASWEPVEAEGPRAGHVFAFVRRDRETALLGAAALRCAAELVEARAWVPRRRWWGETRLRSAGEPLAADLFEDLPVHVGEVERAKGIEPSS